MKSPIYSIFSIWIGSIDQRKEAWGHRLSKVIGCIRIKSTSRLALILIIDIADLLALVHREVCEKLQPKNTSWLAQSCRPIGPALLAGWQTSGAWAEHRPGEYVWTCLGQSWGHTGPWGISGTQSAWSETLTCIIRYQYFSNLVSN